MSDQPARVSPREIASVLAVLRHGAPGDRVALLAWKSSLLERIADGIAATSQDREVRRQAGLVAAVGRARLAAAHADTAVLAAEHAAGEARRAVAAYSSSGSARARRLGGGL